MVFCIFGNFREDFINLPKFKIHIDYGEMDDGSFSGKKQYLRLSERYTGEYRRSQLLDYHGNFISECIEKNPDFECDTTDNYFIAAELKIGNEFERLINFDNGYVAKIEYWQSINNHDSKFGIYDAKYRKTTLFDNGNNIISEVMEDNPHFIDPTIECIISDQDIM